MRGFRLYCGLAVGGGCNVTCYMGGQESTRGLGGTFAGGGLSRRGSSAGDVQFALFYQKNGFPLTLDVFGCPRDNAAIEFG
jgi:hypothetical protein